MSMSVSKIMHLFPKRFLRGNLTVFRDGASTTFSPRLFHCYRTFPFK